MHIAKWLQWLEPVLILGVMYTFWFVDPNRVWSLLIIVPLFVVRWLATGRLLTATPLNWLLLVFLLLGVANVFTAPLSRGSVTLSLPFDGRPLSVPWAWVMLGRPLMGITVFFMLVEFARLRGMRVILGFTILLALSLAVLALLASQWNNKAALLQPIISLFPNYRQLPIAVGGFNANEIAGGLIWFAPFCAALAAHRWPPLRLPALTAFGVLVLALFLGQSRLALIGLVVALLPVIFLLVPRGRWRVLALMGLALFVVLEAVVVTNPFSSPAADVAMQARDTSSNLRRFEMWESVFHILRDHPLTGIGANMYRDVQVRRVYPVPGYENGGPPHAHNEVLQIAADLGLPGVIVFIGWYVAIGYMLVKIWRDGDANARVVAVATGAGLLGHAVFGMGDAVALWDRFIWVFWWMVGIVGGQYALVRATLRRQTRLNPASRPVIGPLEDARPI